MPIHTCFIRPSRMLLLLMPFLLLLTAVWPCRASAEEPDSLAPVQVFDVRQERIVAVIPNSPDIRKHAEQWLQAAPRLSAKSRLDLEQGLVIHIPLSPPVKVNHDGLAFQAVRVYLLIGPQQQENPQLLVFSSEGKPFVFDLPERPESFLQQYKLLELLRKSQANTSSAAG
jgi:hypothetical protein